MATFRVYASGSIISEDLFEEYDNAQPYYDDYREFEVPEELIAYILEECK